MAHDTAAVLGVLSVGAWDDVCATETTVAPLAAVRTSIGLVTASDDGTWAYGCPSLIGANITSVFAADASGELIASIATGELHVSNDGGCTWSRVALPSADHFAYEMAGDLDAIWVLARSPAQAELLRISPDARSTSLATWMRDGETAWTPDAIHVVEDDNGVVLVAGARPTPQLALLRFDGASMTEEQRVVIAAPPIALQRLAPRGLFDSSTAILVATDENGRRVSTVDLQSDGASIDDLLGPVEILHGPVETAQGYVALADGLLYTLDDGVAAHASVPWKCLQRLGDRLFACNLYDMLEIVDIEAALRDATGTVAVFSTAQIGPPSADCGRDADEQSLCNDDWLHYGSENFFLDRTPVLCPDGSGEYPGGDDAGAVDAGGGDNSNTVNGDSPSGCGASPAAGGLLIGLLALSRRRRNRS